MLLLHVQYMATSVLPYMCRLFSETYWQNLPASPCQEQNLLQISPCEGTFKARPHHRTVLVNTSELIACCRTSCLCSQVHQQTPSAGSNSLNTCDYPVARRRSPTRKVSYGPTGLWLSVFSLVIESNMSVPPLAKDQWTRHRILHLKVY